MSSRSNDSQRLATLATQISDVAAGCVRMVGVLSSLNEDYRALHGQVSELSEALDDLERRLLVLERG